MDAPNDLCSGFAVRRCLSSGSDTATRDCLGSWRWPFRCAAVVGSGVCGDDRGVWQQHHSRAGGGWGVAVGLRRRW
jgi:hypothetical protein